MQSSAKEGHFIMSGTERLVLKDEKSDSVFIKIMAIDKTNLSCVSTFRTYKNSISDVCFKIESRAKNDIEEYIFASIGRFIILLISKEDGIERLNTFEGFFEGNVVDFTFGGYSIVTVSSGDPFISQVTFPNIVSDRKKELLKKTINAGRAIRLLQSEVAYSTTRIPISDSNIEQLDFYVGTSLKAMVYGKHIYEVQNYKCDTSTLKKTSAKSNSSFWAKCIEKGLVCQSRSDGHLSFYDEDYMEYQSTGGGPNFKTEYDELATIKYQHSDRYINYFSSSTDLEILDINTKKIRQIEEFFGPESSSDDLVPIKAVSDIEGNSYYGIARNEDKYYICIRQKDMKRSIVEEFSKYNSSGRFLFNFSGSNI